MNKFTNFFQDKVVPMLIAIGENRYMQATRNGMTMIIPFVIIGSIFTVIAREKIFSKRMIFPSSI